MSCNRLMRWKQTLMVAVAAMVWAGDASAQLIRAELDSGFARTSSITMTVDEMFGSRKARPGGQPILGPGYPDLWIAEVQFKPIRYVRVEVTDPKSGETNLELVSYMIWRVIPRDYTELAGDSRDNLLKKLEDPDVKPANSIDGVEAEPIQIPRFTLRTDDAGEQKVYVDEVNLQIQKRVFEREFQERAADLKLFNSVQAISEVTEAVSVHDPDPLSKALYGVAVWRNVDGDSDYFTVSMTGFSNAYRITTDGGEVVVEQKVIEQRFRRPGDRFARRESELRVLGDPNGTTVRLLVPR